MGIVIGDEVYVCMIESVFEAGQSLSVRKVVRTLERDGLGKKLDNISSNSIVANIFANELFTTINDKVVLN